MHADSKKPNEAQQQKLCEMLYHALVEIRIFAVSERGERASDLADAFHNLPHEIWCDYFSLTYFRQAFIEPYARKWSGGRNYAAMLDEVEKLS